MTTAIAPDVSRWAPWTPAEVARVLEGVDAPWHVAGGWAIDLFLGEQRREHDDLEIAVPRNRFDEFAQALEGFELFVITGQDEALPLRAASERLADTHQTWVRDSDSGFWRLDVLREPSDGDTWIFRRNEAIRLPYEEVIGRTADGIPYGRPEIMLLFKAKHEPHAKDHGDFEAALPRLDPARRAWLAGALGRMYPAHPWLEQLR